MSRKTDYFKLGLFTLVGLDLLLAVIIFLGASDIFRNTLVMETYFDESVNGLDVGSPVKYRGVQVGSVSEVGFVAENYGEFFGGKDYRYVMVLCRLDMDRFGDVDEDALLDWVRRDVSKGLRVRPVSQGITGQLYLGIDYVDPKTNPTLAISWKPEHLYLPSAPSTLSKLEAAVTSISDTLSGISKGEVEGLITDLRKVAGSLSTFLDRADAKELSRSIVANLNETEKMFKRVNVILEAPAAAKLLPETLAAVTEFKGILATAGPDVQATVRDTRAAAASVRASSAAVQGFLEDKEVKQGMRELSKTLTNINRASRELKAAAVELNDVLTRVNTVVSGEQDNVRAILDNARVLLENLRELSGDAKRYPAGLIFGSPPPKPQPDEDARP